MKVTNVTKGVDAMGHRLNETERHIEGSRRRRRPFLRLLVGTLAMLATSLVPTPAAEAQFSGPELVFTLNGVRIDAQDLDGAVIPASSNLAVWIAPRWHPAKKVDFYINGQHVHTESSAPWDLSGTGPLGEVQSMWSTDLPAGTNVIEARIDGWFNRDRTLRATFTRAPIDSTTAPGLGLDFTESDQILDSYVRDESLNGAGLVVVHPDHGIVHESYRGVFGPDRVSLTASSNKMINAAVLAHLADTNDDFDLDMPISEVVPWGSSLPGVTTAHLLSNSSGLPGLLTGYVLNTCILDKSITVEECGRRVATNPLNKPLTVAPGDEFRYGGPQWQVAGAIAEHVSGKDWHALVEETLRRPCGLNVLGYTNFARPGMFAENININADLFNGVFGLHPGTVEGSAANIPFAQNAIIEGGGYTTPHDYADLLLMLLRDGRCGNEQILAPETVDMLTTNRLTPAVRDELGNGYGLGWFLDGDIAVDPGFFGAVSWIDLEDGYAAYFVIEHVGLPGQGRRPELVDAVGRTIDASQLSGPGTQPDAPCVVTQAGNSVNLTWQSTGANAYFVRRNGSWVATARGTTATVRGSVDDSWVVRYWPAGGAVDIPCVAR